MGGPLICAALLSDKWFVLALHHSNRDGWSMSKVFESLELEYARLGEDSGTEKRNVVHEQVSFNHFVKALQEQDRGVSAAFWRDALAGASTPPFIPLKPADDRLAKFLLQNTIALPVKTITATTLRAHGTQVELAYSAIGLALYRQLQTSDTVLRLASTGRASATVAEVEDLFGPTVTSVPQRLRHPDEDDGTGAPTLGDFVSHLRDQRRALAPHEHAGLEGAALSHPDAGPACVSAPQVVVHPFDPYAETAADGTGLRRQDLSAFGGDDGAPFTLYVSLVSWGRALEGIKVRALFSDSAVEEMGVRGHVPVLDDIVRVTAKA